MVEVLIRDRDRMKSSEPHPISGMAHHGPQRPAAERDMLQTLSIILPSGVEPFSQPRV